MKINYLLFALIVVVSTLPAAKIPSQVKKSVTFIFAKDSNKALNPLGTGFFVLLKTNQKTDTANFGYLVTSKRTLKKQNGSFYDTVYIRLNRKDGYSDTVTIPLVQNGQQRYFLHPDSTIDLAVVPAYPDLNRYDFLFLPFGMIAPIDFIKKENITEGEEVFHIGMLPNYIGVLKNIPVVRFGRIAQLSEEKYPWDNGATELYLIETTISKGSIGSPLYYYTPSSKDSGNVTIPAKFYLAGIVSGSFGNSGQDKLKLENNGLVGIVPAYKLSELLNIPSVSEERGNEFTRIQNAKAK